MLTKAMSLLNVSNLILRLETASVRSISVSKVLHFQVALLLVPSRDMADTGGTDP